MSKTACPICKTTEILEFPDKLECVTCGYEWLREPEAEVVSGEVRLAEQIKDKAFRTAQSHRTGT